MTLSRTKIMIGVLAVSVGGLAAWADDRCENAHRPISPIMVKSTPLYSTTSGDITTCACPCEKFASRPSPVVSEGPKHCPLEIQATVAAALEPLDYVPPPPPMNTVRQQQPVQQIEIPLTLAPMPTPAVVADPIIPPPPTPNELAPLPAPMVAQAAPMPLVIPMPMPVPVPQAPAPMYVPPVPPLPQAPVPPPVVEAPMIRQASAAPSQPQVPAHANPLRMLLRMGNSETARFEIKYGEELLLKVYADKMEMQAPSNGPQPLAGITATGNVRFYGPGISGTCEQLSIVSATGEVLMKGHVNMKCKKGRLYNEVSADRMLFQIGGTGLVSVSDRSKTSGPVTPASYTK